MTFLYSIHYEKHNKLWPFPECPYSIVFNLQSVLSLFQQNFAKEWTFLQYAYIWMCDDFAMEYIKSDAEYINWDFKITASKPDIKIWKHMNK